MTQRISIIDLQKEVEIDLRPLRAFLTKLRKEVSEADGRHFAVAIIDDDRMWRTNWAFRGKDSTTDVLSFPNDPDELDPDKDNLGDIVISASQAQKQAVENDLSLDIELKQLMLHGLLHLCGYDHENDGGEMNAREFELRKYLGI